MEKTEFIWMDSKLILWDDAKIDVLTHTLHYGLGVFEGIRFYNINNKPAIFRLKEHVNRLFYGCENSNINIPFSKSEITNAIIELIKVNKINSGYIRPLVYLGYGKMGLNPEGCIVNVAIACWPWGSYLGDNPIKVKTSEFIRLHQKSTKTDLKICGHYVNSIFASMDIHKKGYDEALLLDFNENVAEGPGENLFIAKDNIIYTPKLGTILKGITRDSIIKIASDLKIKVIEKDIKLKEVYNADEAFFSGTAAEITAIKSLDDKNIGKTTQGPITTKIKNLFLDTLKGKNNKYMEWLTIVE
ncbi:branched-chain amino acid transaminase [Candidatus Pacearchaeota archaeon]|nr:branched-chain amino acid transaminase [Candidatus Pacearchaeota archaeon]